MTPYELVTIFGWLATIYYSLCVLCYAHAWVVTRLLYRKIPWRQACAMLFLVARSRIHYYLWYPIVSVVILIAFSVAGIHYPLMFTVSLFIFWAHILCYQVLPPSVLLLGTSRNKTLALRHNLERGLYPYRVVVLLEPVAAVSATDSLFTRTLFEWDNLRTSAGSWRSSVFGLIGMVPTIVIDARVSTKGVVEEIHRVVCLGLLDKTLFVANEEGEAPALVDARVQVPASSVQVETIVVDTLKRSFLRHTNSPDDNPVLRRFCKQGIKNKDIQFYANRLSEQMSKIAKEGSKIESYLPKAYRKCVNRDFIEDALSAFRSIGRRPGDATLEIYRDIDKDIETMQSFLHNWGDSVEIDKKVLSLAEDLYSQLKKLKDFISDIPSSMMAGCKEIVIKKRKRGY